MSRVVILGLYFTLAGFTPARAEPFRYPVDVAAAEDGTLYVADLRLPGIWKVTGNMAEVFVQGSKQFQTPLNAIRCLALDGDGQLLAGDSATREVYRVSDTGDLTPLTGGAIGTPMCLAIAPDGTIYVSDLELQRIWKVPAAGGVPEEVAILPAVRGMAFDKLGTLWVVRGVQPQLGKLQDDGTFESVLEERTFSFPNQLTVDDVGHLYVADGYAKSIWKVTPSGTAEQWIQGDPLVNPVGLGWRGTDLLIVDPRANAIFSAAPEGALTRLFPKD